MNKRAKPSSLVQEKQTRFSSEEELIAYRDRVWAKYTYQFGGGFTFRWPTCEVFIGDQRKKLTETEADVLKILIDAWPMPLSTLQISRAFSTNSVIDHSELKVYVRRVRIKLGIPDIILTGGRGVGYQFNPKAVM